MANLQPQTPQMRRHDNSTSQECDTSNKLDWQNVDPNSILSGTELPEVTFVSNTIAPSPPIPASSQPPPLSALNTASMSHSSDAPGSHQTPLSAGLPRLWTDINPSYSVTAPVESNGPSSRKSVESTVRTSNTIHMPSRAPSIKQAFANSLGSSSHIGSAPNSALSSPMLNAMADVTPLPSPLMSGDSPGPWKSLASRPTSREFVMAGPADAVLVTTNGESISSAIVNQSKRRAYHGLIMNASESGLNDPQIHKEKNGEAHSRSRSISEYVPEPMQAPKPRQQAVSGFHPGGTDTATLSISPTETHMRREPHMAVKRGIAPSRPLTPPSSRTGAESSDSDSSLSNKTAFNRPKKGRHEYFYAHTLHDEKRRRWRALKLLGEGTFSKVILATSQPPEEENMISEDEVLGQTMEGIIPLHSGLNVDLKKLVAIKICEHGPKGGASEERVEMSLKRELEIMKSIHHPSLVQLKAWNIEDTRAILVLSYCPGGDLFDVASQHRDLLVPSLLRRMFAELIAAVQYLHDRHIVHRDIKLENVLVNLSQQELAKPFDWATYPYSVVTLTDLGLSRRVADDEKLTTRCGSDDYAAPEVIMGQPYDGRAVDAWSLGVLLYALLESRLPFDPTPGMSEGHKQRSKTSHRIARVEWCWVLYAGDDGDHEGSITKFEEAGLKGAMDVTEGFLKRARSRWSIEKAAAEAWVKDAIAIEGGIRFREEHTPEEVSTL